MTQRHALALPAQHLLQDVQHLWHGLHVTATTDARKQVNQLADCVSLDQLVFYTCVILRQPGVQSTQYANLELQVL